MKYTLLLFMTALACLAFVQPAGKLQQVLPGTWKMKTARGDLFEEWKTAGNGLQGRSYRLNGQDTVVMETIELKAEGGELYYIPTVRNQNGGQPVRFKLSGIVGNYHIFENAAHDFPQRIIYETVSRDSIHARIEGSRNGKAASSDFYYSRVQ